MNIKIKKKNLEKLNINEWKEKCNQALDYLWDSAWVRASITKGDRKNFAKLQQLAEEISGQSDIVLVIAGGSVGRLLKGILAAVPVKEGGAEVIVFGDTFSPTDYEALLQHLEGRDFSIVAVTEGEESLQIRAAYTCLKQNLVSRYGQEKAVERIYAVAGKKSILFAQEASENDYPVILYPEHIPVAYGAGTDAVLLLLTVKGYNAEEYLDGFYDMLASPAWDLDGADYAIAKAIAAKINGTKETFIIWQNQLKDFGLLQKSVQTSEAALLEMPFDENSFSENSFETYLMIKEEETDIMMPYFEGCSMEGSLGALLKETADKAFTQRNADAPGVEIYVESLNAYNLGQLTAFMQLSNAISEYLRLLVN